MYACSASQMVWFMMYLFYRSRSLGRQQNFLIKCIVIVCQYDFCRCAVICPLKHFVSRIALLDCIIIKKYRPLLKTWVEGFWGQRERKYWEKSRPNSATTCRPLSRPCHVDGATATAKSVWIWAAVAAWKGQAAARSCPVCPPQLSSSSRRWSR